MWQQNYEVVIQKAFLEDKMAHFSTIKILNNMFLIQQLNHLKL